MSANSPVTPHLCSLPDGNFILDGVNTTLSELLAKALHCHRSGDTALATHFYKAILEMEPGHLSSLHGLGLVAISKNELNEGLRYLNQALDIAPDNAALYYDRALLFQKQGEYSAAIKNYDLALFLNTSLVPAYSNRGIALEAIGEVGLALGNYERALCLDPAFANAWYNRGNIYKSNQAFEQAIKCYLVATQLLPIFWEAFTNLGLSYYALKRFSLAMNAYDQALSLQPNSAVIHYNRANALRTSGETIKAKAGYNRAIELNPQFAAAFANRGLVEKDLNQLEAASQDYCAALALNPELLEATWNQSIVQLMRGEWLLGWEGYELRFQHNDLKESVGERHFAEPRWSRGLPLNGKRILIYAEQGLGDAIQFCRYIPLLQKLGAFVILEVQPALKNLFNNFEGINQLVVKDSVNLNLLSFDYYCPLLSLPREFQTTPENVPPELPFELSTELITHWQKLVDKHVVKANYRGAKKIGLVWQGNPRHTNDHNRSLRLESLLKHLPKEFVYFVVQKEISDADCELLKEHANIINVSPKLSDLTDTACLCLQLDLVVCVDTSVAHLSASLCKSTWLMLPFCPDWRWLTERVDSPWYKNVRLFRQSSPGNWMSALVRMRDELILTMSI